MKKFPTYSTFQQAFGKKISVSLSAPRLKSWAGMLGLLLLLAAPAFSQNKLADKANEAFKLTQYAEAAGLYEQALAEAKPSKSTGALKTKLAYCYRMNNRMDKAEPLYAELAADEKAKPEILFFYGESLMSNGKYEAAKKTFLDYQRLEPEDPKAALMVNACDKVPLIQPYFQYVDIQEFTQNSPADDNSPMPWQGGVVFSSDRPSGIKLLKEKSGWTGRDYLDLYFAEKLPDGSFKEPSQFSSKLSEVNKNTGNASFSKDGSEVFFTRNDNSLNQHDTYNLQLYQATSTGSDRWKDVEKISFCIPAFNFMHPALSPDGKLLFFASNKAGGQGGVDLWVARRKTDGWQKPENLGASINTVANEGFPFMDAGGKLYFCSKGHPGYGGFDIFVTEQDENGNWAPPVNLGKPLNSSLDDISIYVAPDRSGGMFTSSRSGGDDDIFLFSVLDEAPTAPVTEEAVQEPEPESEHWETPIQPTEEVAEISAKVIENEPVSPETTLPTDEIIEENQAPSLPEQTIVQPQEPEVVFVKEEIVEPESVGSELPIAIGTAVTTETPKIAVVEEQSIKIESVSNSPKIIENQPVATESETALVSPQPQTVALFSFRDLEMQIEDGKLKPGDRFRLDGATFDPNVWQLTPRVALMLDKLVKALRRNPSLEIEIGAHTEALGLDEQNAFLSENRAKLALEYIVREGISADRLSATGYGESMPLNGCRNGVTCSMEEHLVNQRLEIKVLKM